MDFRWITLCAVLAAPLTAAAQSQSEGETAPHIAVELNAASDAEAGGCTFSFLITNRAGIAVDQVVYETVLFDTEGQVDRLTLFDFGALPPDRPRVRQFTLPERACAGYGRILFNGASTCEAEGAAQEVCVDGLRLESRTEIEVVG